MALQPSGQIRMSDVATEFGISNSNLSLKTLSDDTGSTTINDCSTDKPDKLIPHAMSEWYSYDHSQGCTATLYVTEVGWDSEHDSCRYYDEKEVYATASNPILNHYLYTNIGLTTLLNTNHHIWGFRRSSVDDMWIDTDNGGKVTTNDDCGNRLAFKMTEPEVTKTAACNSSASSVLKYHGNSDTTTDGCFRFPRLDDVIYESSNPLVTTTFNGANNWYKISGKRYQTTTTDIVIQVDANGAVIDYDFCGTNKVFNMDPNIYNSSNDACGGAVTPNFGGHSGYGEVPAIGDYVHENGGGPVQDGWYYVETSHAHPYLIHVSAGSVVEQKNHCSYNLNATDTISLYASDYSVGACQMFGTQSVNSTSINSGGFEVGEFIFQNNYPFRGAHGKWLYTNGGNDYQLVIEDTGLIVSKVQC